MIVTNVMKPLAFTSANPDHDASGNRANGTDPPNDNNGDKSQTSIQPQEDDTSAAKLVGLYIISDLFSSSSTSGVRHAWRYRSLFESALKRYLTFEHLGRLEKTLRWGRLRAEKWKRSINNILELWAGWCVFSGDSQAEFSSMFNDPPLSKEEEAEKEAEEEEKKAREAKKRWKTLDENAEHAGEQEEEEAQAGDQVDEDAMEVDWIEGESDVGEGVIETAGSSTGNTVKRARSSKPKTIARETSAKLECLTLIEAAGSDSGGMIGMLNGDRRAASAARVASRQALAARSEAPAEPGMVRKRQRPKAEDMFASDEE